MSAKKRGPKECPPHQWGKAEMASQFAHLTAAQAATLAKEAGVGQLILTHISRRYREKDIIREARSVFKNTHLARDFDTLQIKRSTK